MRIVATGDLILAEPDPDSFFEPSAPVLQAADVAIGQLEVPHTDDKGAYASDPVPTSHVAAIPRAGFHAVTMSANHLYDRGPGGVRDTLDAARGYGLLTSGAGMTLDEARRPAIIESNGRTVGLLNFNCVGPRETWARHNKAGGAYVQILTHYELDNANPGGPPTINTWCERTSLAQMEDDIRALRERVDVVVVGFHKGLVHIPAYVADYEFDVAHAAVDAGADMIVSHHAHILRGVEMYRDKPIYHGLGNFVTVTMALAPNPKAAPDDWVNRRKKLFGFEPDPTMPLYYQFHPESRNTAIAVLDVADDGTLQPGLIPCWIDEKARPVPLGPGGKGDEVLDYIRDITRRGGLNSTFRWDGDVVRIDAA